jgi:SAM-dependent methyltransferase
MADATRFNPLRDLTQMASLIAEASEVSPDVAEKRLQLELQHPGRSVADDFASRSARRYEPGPVMEHFYNTTDAFLYELAVWNRNRLKQGMRKWIARHMKRFAASKGEQSLDVLSIGDGMGFDCLHWAQQSHRVTYFELPGLGERFARRLFDRMDVNIPMLTDPEKIPAGSFDALTCLDVLEHVPDVPAMVKSLASYLRPGGVMYVSAPFFLILPWYPTHLRQNRRFSGSLAPYRDAGLELIGGRPGWDPIVLRKRGGEGNGTGSVIGAAAVRAGSLLWMPGRVAAWPYAPLHWLRRWTNRPFK